MSGLLGVAKKWWRPCILSEVTEFSHLSPFSLSRGSGPGSFLDPLPNKMVGGAWPLRGFLCDLILLAVIFRTAS